MAEENGTRPDLVVSTSAGSLVAALYALGRGGADLAQPAQSMDETAIPDGPFPGRGLTCGQAPARCVRQLTGRRAV